MLVYRVEKEIKEAIRYQRVVDASMLNGETSFDDNDSAEWRGYEYGLKMALEIIKEVMDVE